MVSVRFQDFRAFQDTGTVEIRPVTFLVGENSAGKTSFLAGLRYLFESYSRRYPNPFNREPYFLGGFQQIAHYRGGRGGRAKSFSLSIDLSGSGARPRRGERSGPEEEQPVTHAFSFIRGSPQPEIDSYSATTPEFTLTYSFSHEQPKLTIARNERRGASLTYSLRRMPPSRLIKDNNGYIANLVDDLRFGVHRVQGNGELDADQTPINFESIGLDPSAMENLWYLLRQTGSTEAKMSMPQHRSVLNLFGPTRLLS